MPDLARDAVMDWITVQVPNLPAFCPAPIRAVEDEPDIHAALQALGRACDHEALSGRPLADCLGGGTPAEDLSAVLLQLGPARLLRLLDWLGASADAERAAILRALLNGQTDAARALWTAVAALHRHELLARMFRDDRLAKLLAATTTARLGDAA